MRFKSLSTDYILEQGRQDGITIGRKDGIIIGEKRGRQEERKVIMERLIATGMPPSQAASLTGVSVESQVRCV